MANNENKKLLNKFVIISDIKNLREITNYLLDNFDKNQIKLELFYSEEKNKPKLRINK